VVPCGTPDFTKYENENTYRRTSIGQITMEPINTTREKSKLMKKEIVGNKLKSIT
jgi:hypothetical protein